MRTFQAMAVSAAELRDLNVFVVVMAEETDGAGMRLEIQKALSFDDMDRDSGQDTYCLCTESGATHYGGVVSWSIAPGALEVLLDPSAAEALGVEEGFHVNFPRESVVLLKGGLERTLGPSRMPSSR